MDDLREQMISSQLKYQGRIVNVKLDEVKLPSGMETKREVVEHPGAVAVISSNNEGKLVLVKQFRYPVGESLLEVPAGKLEPDESPENCAKREMMEETGYSIGRLKLIAGLYTTPGFCNEVIHIYAGYELDYKGLTIDGGINTEDYDEENIKVIHIAPDEAIKMIYNGQINDAKTVAAILLYLNQSNTGK